MGIPKGAIWEDRPFGHRDGIVRVELVADNGTVELRSRPGVDHVAWTARAYCSKVRPKDGSRCVCIESNCPTPGIAKRLARQDYLLAERLAAQLDEEAEK